MLQKSSLPINTNTQSFKGRLKKNEKMKAKKKKKAKTKQ